MSHHVPKTLLSRLRRASSLRFVFVIAAVLASQNFLACAFEEWTGGQGVELGTGQAAAFAADDGSGDDCCALCLECANCNGCCGMAASTRSHAASPALVSSALTKITLDTVAPAFWTPPTLLRPPIEAA
jgi:hypothetical protein